MNPNKCPCECHETFDHGSSLVVHTYAKRIRELEEMVRDQDTELDDLRVALKEEQAEKDLWLSVRDQMLADIANLKDDVKRYRNG